MIKDKISIQELIEKYESSQEQWKVKLAATIVVEMGVPNRLWEDLMQEVMLHILQLKLRPIDEVQNSTVLYKRIRSRIIDFLRKEKRQQLKTEKLSTLDSQVEYTVDILHICGEDSHDTLARAVRAATEKLDKKQQKICRLFMQGYNLHNTAKILKIRRHELKKNISLIRRKFILLRIEEIITWREEKRL